MNFIETIYCSQFYELKKSGRDPMKARINGTLLTATVILLTLVSLITIVNRLMPNNALEHFARGIAKNVIPGRSLGKVVGLLGLLIVGGTLHFTYASVENYRKMMLKWDQLPVEILEKTLKDALKIFGIVFGTFLILVVASFF
jgi:hypothetical protein